MRSLHAKIDKSRNRSAVIAGKFQTAITDAEKNRLARLYDRALKRAHHLQHQLEVLERKERESTINPTHRATTEH